MGQLEVTQLVLEWQRWAGQNDGPWRWHCSPAHLDFQNC